MKIGVVGCGEISRIHVPAYKAISDCEVVGTCDLVKDRAEALAKMYNIPNTYSDLSSMLKSQELDIIDVTTQPQVHAALCIEAMNSGCNVLVEKPMCMTVQEADQMIQAAKHNKVKLGVAHSFIFNPAIRKALAKTKQGEIGDLLWVDTTVSINSLLEWEKAPGFPKWYYTLSGGLFGEIIPHGLYVQLAFLGKIRKAWGLARKTGTTSELVPFSDVHITMDCENGIGGLFISTRPVTRYTVMTTRVLGSLGTLQVNIPAASVQKIRMGRSSSFLGRAAMNLEPALDLMYSNVAVGARALLGSVKPHMTHNAVIRGFVQSVKDGSEPPVTAQDGREVVKATEMIWNNITTAS